MEAEVEVLAFFEERAEVSLVQEPYSSYPTVPEKPNYCHFLPLYFLPLPHLGQRYEYQSEITLSMAMLGQFEQFQTRVLVSPKGCCDIPKDKLATE